MADWRAEEWSALAACVTAAVAVLAACVAIWQVREARRLREEQAQPYVVAYMEPTAATPQIIDLVIKNFGSTAATDVTFRADPPLRRSDQAGESEAVELFEIIPVLVPGQEWRTMWDFGPERARTELPDRYNVVLAYGDSRRKRLPPLRFELDWRPYKTRRWVTIYGLHDIAKSLREINRTTGRWREGIRGGLAVYVRDGDAKDAEEARRIEQWRKAEESVRPASGDRLEPPAPLDEG